MQHRQYPPRFRNGRGVGKKRTFGATLVSSNVKKSKFGKKRQYAAKGWKKSGRNRRIIRKKRLRGARYARICFLNGLFEGIRPEIFIAAGIVLLAVDCLIAFRAERETVFAALALFTGGLSFCPRLFPPVFPTWTRWCMDCCCL